MLPTNANVTIQTKKKMVGEVDAVVAFVTQGAQRIDAGLISKEDREAGERLLKAGVVRGKARELAFDLVQAGKGYQRMYVVGLGDETKLSTETLRQAAG